MHKLTPNFTISHTVSLTFWLFWPFPKTDKTRPDLPITSVTRIPIVTVLPVWPLEDNDRETHTDGDGPIIQTGNHKVLHVTPGADELSRQSPNGIFCYRWVLLGTTPTRQGTWSGSISHGHYAKQWSRVLGDIWLKLTMEACIIPLGIHFKVRKRRY